MGVYRPLAFWGVAKMGVAAIASAYIQWSMDSWEFAAVAATGRLKGRLSYKGRFRGGGGVMGVATPQMILKSPAHLGLKYESIMKRYSSNYRTHVELWFMAS